MGAGVASRAFCDSSWTGFSIKISKALLKARRRASRIWIFFSKSRRSANARPMEL